MKLFWLIVLLISFLTAGAQRRLTLIKKNTIISRYIEGERIRFKRKGEKDFSKGIITGIGLDFIKLGDQDTVYVYQFASIDIRNHPHGTFKTAEAGSKIFVAGLMLLVINSANQVNGAADNGLIAVSSSLMAAGVVMQFVNNNYFKPGRKKRVIIMN